MKIILAGLLLLMSVQSLYAQDRQPIIDVHLHAYISIPAGESADWTGEPESRVLAGAVDADEHFRSTLAQMNKYNIVKLHALVSSTTTLM